MLNVSLGKFSPVIKKLEENFGTPQKPLPSARQAFYAGFCLAYSMRDGVNLIDPIAKSMSSIGIFDSDAGYFNDHFVPQLATLCGALRYEELHCSFTVSPWAKIQKTLKDWPRFFSEEIWSQRNSPRFCDHEKQKLCVELVEQCVKIVDKIGDDVKARLDSQRPPPGSLYSRPLPAGCVL